jgi:hypothetical protein
MLERILSLLRPSTPASDLATSRLLNEETFYPVLMQDLKQCHSELIIECPFVTNKRLSTLLLQKLKTQKVRVVVNTRDPKDMDDEYRRADTLEALSRLQHLGVHVVYTGGHHRKLVILDRSIVYEGSLNVLSQNSSSEIMRRIESVALAWQMVKFVGMDNYV